MKYISITLLCAAVVLTGLNAAAERRKRIRIFERLSVLFASLAADIKKGSCGFLILLGDMARQERFGMFTFIPDTLLSAANGDDIALSWQNAVNADKMLSRTGNDNIRAVRELSLCFCEAAPAVFADACFDLSRRFENERERSVKKSEKDERLLIAGSVLGAAALCIILI